jgi:hypothetical protein
MTVTLSVLDQVRQAIEEAQAAGVPAPGRPALAKLTGATDHQVRKALATLEKAGEETSPVFASVSPAVASAVDEGDEGPLDSGDPWRCPGDGWRRPGDGW